MLKGVGRPLSRAVRLDRDRLTAFEAFHGLFDFCEIPDNLPCGPGRVADEIYSEFNVEIGHRLSFRSQGGPHITPGVEVDLSGFVEPKKRFVPGPFSNGRDPLAERRGHPRHNRPPLRRVDLYSPIRLARNRRGKKS